MDICKKQLDIKVWWLRDVYGGDLEFISMKMLFKSRAIGDVT